MFTREDGTPLHPQTATWHFMKLTRAADVPTIRFHDLRHTHATLGLTAGVPPKVMQERLGHSSVQITLDLYSHVVPACRRTLQPGSRRPTADRTPQARTLRSSTAS